MNDSNDGQQILLKVRWLLIFLLLTNLKNILGFTADKSLKFFPVNFININTIGKLQEKYSEQSYIFHLDSPVVNILPHLFYHHYCYASFVLFMNLSIIIITLLKKLQVGYKHLDTSSLNTEACIIPKQGYFPI